MLLSVPNSGLLCRKPKLGKGSSGFIYRLRKPFYLATITLASIHIWLRDDESTT